LTPAGAYPDYRPALRRPRRLEARSPRPQPAAPDPAARRTRCPRRRLRQPRRGHWHANARRPSAAPHPRGVGRPGRARDGLVGSAPGGWELSALWQAQGRPAGASTQTHHTGGDRTGV